MRKAVSRDRPKFEMINYPNPDFSDIPWGRKLAEVYNPDKAEYWPPGTESFASRFVAAGVLLGSKFGQTDHSSVESEPHR